MAIKTSALSSATNIATTDLIQVVDVNDTTMAPTGTNKKATAQVVGNNLPVVATGSTTSRKLNDRFADTVNVKDFGAVGGVTDNTTAIQTAIAYAVATGAKVIIPFEATINIFNSLTNLNTILNTVVYNGFKLTINITSGTTISDQIFIDGKNLAWVAITSDDAEVTVNSSDTAIPNANPLVIYNDDGTTSSSSTYGFISIFNQGVGPVISTLFTMNTATTTKRGFIVANGSSMTVSAGAGIKNTGSDAVLVYFNSTFTADGAIFDNAGYRGIWARWGCIVSFGGGSAVNVGWTAFQMHNSNGNCQTAILTGAGHYGIRARRSSKIEAQGAIVDNAAGHGVNVNETSEVNFRDGSALNCGSSSVILPTGDFTIQVTEGSSLNFNGAKVSTNNTVGMIRCAGASTIYAGNVYLTPNAGSGYDVAAQQGSRVDITSARTSAGVPHDVSALKLLYLPNQMVAGNCISHENSLGLEEGEGPVLTISGGAVTPTHKLHKIATPNALTDNLYKINYNNMVNGDVFTFISNDPTTKAITIQHAISDGRIRTADGLNRTIGKEAKLFGYTFYNDSSNFQRGLS